jgi:hypothetical protein
MEQRKGKQSAGAAAKTTEGTEEGWRRGGVRVVVVSTTRSKAIHVAAG